MPDPRKALIPSPPPPPRQDEVDAVCPACGAGLVTESCKVVCPRCRRIVFNCSEF